MADIFNVQPPAWLQQATQQKPGQLGDIGGLLAGGLINALQKKEPEQERVQDPKTGEVTWQAKPDTGTGVAGWLESRKGLKEGFAEARLNTDDPQWKLKAEQAKASLWGQVAQNEMQYAQLKDHNQEMAAWQNAFPGAQEWFTATPEQRAKMPVPDAGGSKQLMAAIQKTQQQDEILSYRKTQAETAKQNALNKSAENQINIANAKEGLKAVEPLGAAARAKIGTPKGPGGTYTDEQWGIINDERSKVPGLPPAGMKEQKPLGAQSAIGKLQADKAIELAKGDKADKKLLSAYDQAIENAAAGKSESPEGKLIDDIIKYRKDPNSDPRLVAALEDALEKKTADAEEVKISDVKGTDYILFQSPKTGTFTVKSRTTGQDVKVSAREMLELADAMPDSDPNKKLIMNRLIDAATGKKLQHGGAAAEPGAAAPGTKPGVRVLSITPKGGVEKKFGEGAPTATEGAAAAAPAASPQSAASTEFFDTVKKELAKDSSSYVGDNAVKSLAKQLAERVPIKKDSDLLRIGDSTLYHSPEKAYYDALVKGNYRSLSGDKVWEYIMGLPEDEQRKMFQQALKDAKAKK